VTKVDEAPGHGEHRRLAAIVGRNHARHGLTHEPSAAGAQQNDMSNKIFLAIVTAIMLAVLLPLLAQKFHECMEKGGSACPCKMGCPPVRAAHAPDS
jgi:hypothetical protein